MTYKIKDETLKTLRIIMNYLWAMNESDIEKDTSQFYYFVNDLINYAVNGESNYLSNLDNVTALDPEANEEDYQMARSMFLTTKQLINDLYAKMEEIDNKVGKNRII